MSRCAICISFHVTVPALTLHVNFCGRRNTFKIRCPSESIISLPLDKACVLLLLSYSTHYETPWAGGGEEKPMISIRYGLCATGNLSFNKNKAKLPHKSTTRLPLFTHSGNHKGSVSHSSSFSMKLKPVRTCS